MDPVSAGLMIVGTGVKAFAQNSAGVHNKRVAYAQASEEELAGSQKELRIRESARKAIGQQVAAQAGNGFLGGTGSALDALAESQINAELDVLTIRREAMSRAKSLRDQGDMAKREGQMNAIGSILGGASSLYGMSQDWAAARKPGS